VAGRTRRVAVDAHPLERGMLLRVRPEARSLAAFVRELDLLPLPASVVRDGAFVDVNRRFLELFGFADPTDVIGRPYLDRWSEGSRAEAERLVARLLDDPRSEVEFTGFARAADGAELPVRVALAGLDTPEGLGVLGFFHDLREQRRAEEALRRSEAFHRALLTRSPEILTVIGADGRYRYASSAAETQLGYAFSSLEGVPAVDLVHPEDRPRWQEATQKLLADPSHVERVRYRLKRSDGAYRVFEAIAVNLLDNPDVLGLVGAARDVTEQVQLEEQLRQSQKLESIGRLAGGVAHDFNNVLTIILSSTELLEEAMKNGLAPAIEDVHEIASAAQRASELTQQLLAVARKQVIAPVAVDLDAIVRGSEKMLRRLLGEDVALVLKLDPHAGAMIADPGQLHQVLLNLAVNARDAMPKGGLLTIETARVIVPIGWRDLPPGEWVRLVVRDSGVGMAPDVLAHVFEPFFTTKPVGRGTGLGLATVHGIVAQCGGHIRVESAKGQGARFDVYFPAASAAVASAAAQRAPTTARGSETLLMVEDDRSVREVAARTLENAGFRVISARDGYEALAAYEGIPGGVALLVTDVVMPRLDGPRLAAVLRERQPELRVLFTSGYTDDRIAAHGMLEPDVDFLPKPYTPSTLLHRVRAALDRGAEAAG
jgi:two-component system cell cycle sensor histidine kinase/response regulator CckA